MNIDWSKAPEDATHAGSFKGKLSCWYKLGSGWVWEYMSDLSFSWEKVSGNLPASDLIERQNKQEAWDGVGIPTVGMECEVFEGPALWRNSGMSDWVGRKVKVKSTFINNIGQKIASVESDNAECACFIVECLRPIKTAEKLAEEEKVAAIAEMQAVVMAASGCTVSTISEILAIVALYEAGYRKQ